jgi:hypothetical protein
LTTALRSTSFKEHFYARTDGKLRDPNFPTGCDDLIAVDKVGNKVLFLDPATFETVEVLNGFAPRVHELAISPDHPRAYAPIYGDGITGSHNEAIQWALTPRRSDQASMVLARNP